MDKDKIVIRPHYINSLKYYDKLFPFLLEENIDLVYVLKRDNEMENYCKLNGRKYVVLNFREDKGTRNIFDPFIRYKFKRRVNILFKDIKPKLVIQTNDMHVFNDIIVKVAKKFKIMTLVLGWAITAPEEKYFEKREREYSKLIKKRSGFQNLVDKFLKIFLRIINTPLYLFFNVYSNHKMSFSQGNSDIVAVINRFTKNLLVKQGVDENKIRIVGSLHYDDSLNSIKKKSPIIIKKKLNLNTNDVVITYFSQPFYTKDIKILSFEEQLEYVKLIINKVDRFYKEIKKSYIFLFKLHPAENKKDYNIFLNKDNVKIFTETDNTDLILVSDVCISQHSSVIQSVIVMKKPILSLNILGLDIIREGAKVLGISNCINTWDEFIENLKLFERNNYSVLNNIIYDRVILDGKCYTRIINLIKNMINLTKLK